MHTKNPLNAVQEFHLWTNPLIGIFRVGGFLSHNLSKSFRKFWRLDMKLCLFTTWEISFMLLLVAKTTESSWGLLLSNLPDATRIESDLILHSLILPPTTLHSIHLVLPPPTIDFIQLVLPPPTIHSIFLVRHQLPFIQLIHFINLLYTKHHLFHFFH